MADLTGKKIAIVSTDYFEELELTEPLEQLAEMGADITVAAPHDGAIQGLRHVEQGREITVDTTIDQLDPEEFDAVIIPGGVVNADHLRMDQAAQEFVQAMDDAGKPVAAICHGPWLLVSSGLVEERTLTSYPTLQDDITNAGGIWVDQEVVTDKNFITSRNPDDLPVFIQSIHDALVQA